MEKNNSNIMFKIQKTMQPIGNYLSNQRHFSAITAGLMSVLGVLIIGAFAQILSGIVSMFGENGVLAIYLGLNFTWIENVQGFLDIPYQMTTGLMSVLVSYGIAYQLAKSYKMNQIQSGLTAMLMFIMIAAPVKTYLLADGITTVNALDVTFLSSTGMFTAIVIALISVEISHFCIKKNWVINMPEVVPSFLRDAFNAMIPMIVNLIIIYGFNSALMLIDPSLNIVTAVTAIFMIPVKYFVGSVFGMFLLNTFATLLWTTGIHGTMIALPFILPVLIQAISQNGALYAQGLPMVFDPSFLFMAVAAIGGTGGTIGLVILSSYFAKSEQLKAVGKVSLIPGFFNVNEPATFGFPIVLNPILAIPYVLNTIVLTALMWLGFTFGLLALPRVLFIGIMPIGVADFLSSLSLKNFIFMWLMVPVTALIYYPFFKVYDKELVEKEKLIVEKAV